MNGAEESDTKLMEVLDALEDMVWQFCSHDGKLSHRFMSAEEHAFEVLEKFGRIEVVDGVPEMVSQREGDGR